MSSQGLLVNLSRNSVVRWTVEALTNILGRAPAIWSASLMRLC